MAIFNIELVLGILGDRSESKGSIEQRSLNGGLRRQAIMVLASFAGSRYFSSVLIFYSLFVISSRAALRRCSDFRCHVLESWVSWATSGEGSETLLIGGMVAHLQATDDKRCQEPGQAI